MTCKDCINEGHCGFTCSEDWEVDKSNCFKDKSEWVHLPCKFGDSIYIIRDINGYRLIDKGFADYFSLWKDHDIRIGVQFSDGMKHYNIRELNEKFYFTKEEAEKALEERTKEK